VLRLAGTLAYLSWSIGVSPEPSEIDCSSLQSAVDLWRDYFWPHARASLRQVGLSDRHTNSRRVLLWIKSRGLTAVSLKDARRDALSQSLDGSHTEQLLDSLAEAGWLRKHMEKTGGRPQHRWTVNPLLFGHAESAATAESRYGAAAQNMQQACHGQPGS